MFIGPLPSTLDARRPHPTPHVLTTKNCSLSRIPDEVLEL